MGIDVNNQPVVLNIIHGISVEFTSSELTVESIFQWIRAAKHGKVKYVDRVLLPQIREREDLLLMLFFSERQKPLAAKLKV